MLSQIRIVSKKLSLFIVLALLMSTVQVSFPQEESRWERFKAGVGKTFKEAMPDIAKRFTGSIKDMAKSATSKIKSGVATTIEKVRTLGPKLLIPKTLEAIEKFGRQIGTISSCMLSGQGCSASERAAFIATATVVFVLTAALVGATIAVAATSKEIEAATEQTSEQVKGWSPAAIFQRLQNTTNSFKQNLLEMKTCILNRTCTKTQKRMLYGTAGTIIALSTIAIGLGIGSYIYAQKREAKINRQQEEARKQQEIAALQKKIEQAQTDEERARAQEELRKKLEMAAFDDTPTPADKWASLTKFQKLFRKNIDVVKGAATKLKALYNEIQQDIKNGTIKAKNQISEKFTKFIEQAKQFPGLVKQTLAVNIGKLKNTFSEFKGSLANLKNALSTSWAGKMLSLTKQFNSLNQYIKNMTHAMQHPRIKGQKLSYLENMLQIRKREFQAGRISEKQVKQVEKDIEVKKFIKNNPFKSFYPELVKKINELDLSPIGNVARTLLNGLSSLVAASRKIHTGAGKIGLVVSQPNIKQSLSKIESGLQSLGKHIESALSVRPLIVPSDLGTLGIAKAFLKAVKTNSFKFLRENLGIKKDLIAEFEPLGTTMEAIENNLARFSRQISNLKSSTKREFVARIKEAPIKNIPIAAKILRNALEKTVKTTKRTFSNLMIQTSQLLSGIAKIAPIPLKIVRDLNNYVETAIEKSFINKQFIESVVQMITNSLVNINQGVRELTTNIDKIEIQQK